MVPDKFNMVDMGGIDLIMMQGEEVPGLYNRLVESITQCRYQCLYNWLFDGVIIPPTYVELEVNENDEVVINEGVVVTSDDVIRIYSIEPPTPEPEIIPLLAEENGVYESPAGVDGFNPVTVDVPSYTPVINPITVIENGIYNPPTGVDGYAPITVNVPTVSSDGEYWDLSDSFTGSILGINSTRSNVEIQSDGAHFQWNGALRFGIGWNGMTIEIETGDFQQTSGSHRRFVMAGELNSGVGFIYRQTGIWAFYNNSWVESSERDGSFFDNCTVKIYIDSTGHWHIYKNDVLFWEPSLALNLDFNYPVLGSTGGGIVGTIKSFRVY